MIDAGQEQTDIIVNSVTKKAAGPPPSGPAVHMGVIGHA